MSFWTSNQPQPKPEDCEPKEFGEQLANRTNISCPTTPLARTSSIHRQIREIRNWLTISCSDQYDTSVDKESRIIYINFKFNILLVRHSLYIIFNWYFKNILFIVFYIKNFHQYHIGDPFSLQVPLSYSDHLWSPLDKSNIKKKSEEKKWDSYINKFFEGFL